MPVSVATTPANTISSQALTKNAGPAATTLAMLSLIDSYPETFREMFAVADFTTGPGSLRSEAWATWRSTWGWLPTGW